MIKAHLAHLDDAAYKSLVAAGNVSESLEREDLEPDLVQLNVLDIPLTNLLNQNETLARAYEHEYTVVTNRLDKIGYAAFRDGQIPRTVEINTARRRIRPQLIGHRITVTELATRTTENGIMQIDELVRNEKILAVSNEAEYINIYGDANLGGDVAGSPNNFQQDGMINIVKKGAPQNVVDAAGAPLSVSLLWQAEARVVSSQSNARPSDVFISYIDKLNLQADFYQISRSMTDQQRRAGLLGADAQSYIGIRGEHTLYPNQFLGDFHKFNQFRFGSESGEFAAPSEGWNVSLKTTGGYTGGLIADGGSALTTSVSAVTFSYAFKVANFFGETTAKFIDVTGVTAGQTVGISITGLTNAKWMDVYRKDPGSSEYKFYKRVPFSSISSSADFIDNGLESITSFNGTYTWKKIPGTGVVFGVDRVVTSLAKWIGLELYRLPPALTHDWVIWKVASIFSRAPEFNYLITNVSQTPIVDAALLAPYGQ